MISKSLQKKKKKKKKKKQKKKKKKKKKKTKKKNWLLNTDKQKAFNKNSEYSDQRRIQDFAKRKVTQR